MPVAPSGWPLDKRPPETLTGTPPPNYTSPSSINLPASPSSQRPKFS